MCVAFCQAAAAPLSKYPSNKMCSPRPSKNLPLCKAGTPFQPARIVIGTASAMVLAFSSLSPVFAISAEQCIGGEGPGCAAAAAESPLIAELLEKSRANKAKHDKETLEEYWERGYRDYFSFGYNKELVHGEDGKWSLQAPTDARARFEQRIIDMIRGRRSEQ